jgi:hypothetical protein
LVFFAQRYRARCPLGGEAAGARRVVIERLAGLPEEVALVLFHAELRR